MKKIAFLLIAALATIAATAQQTMWVCTGQVKYAYNTASVGVMPYTSGSTLTVLDKSFALAEVDSIYVDDNEFDDDNILVNYDGDKAWVTVAGNIATHITATVKGAHVAVLQDASVADEYYYTLQGSSTNGSFYQDGKLKISVILNGLTLNNPDSAAINIRDGKRISVELAAGTVNTLTDGTGGSQKGCFAVKGHTEFKGGGTLNITGNSSHAFWGKEYVQLKKTVGTINILGAVADGFNVNQYFQMNGGTVNISGTGDDGLQVSYETDDDDNIEVDADNTGDVTIKGGTLKISTTGAGSKALKVAHDYIMSAGDVTIDQSGTFASDSTDIAYTVGVKTGNDINITGGSVTITNTADGGKGLSADGAIIINENAATTNINITANGKGGVAENVNTGGQEETKSYKLYVTLPRSSGGFGSSNPWTKVYLYKEDGTLVQQLTSTVSRTSGYSTLTFYYYDFKEADSGTYYFKADNFTSRGTSYTIKTVTFTGPTTGSDVYYSISSSYSTSGTTRTYSISNVTSSYGGSSDTSEDNGTSYNAAGIKADGAITIGGGTIEVKNSGEMSKSIKLKGTVTIDGGNLTLTPSGAMKVINSDASYSSAIKAVDFVQNGGTITINASGGAGKGVSANGGITTNGGTLTITNTGAGQTGTNDTYTAKGLKADGNMALNAGTITITMSGTGGKGVKVNGTYTQGKSDGTGPTLKITTSGTSLGGTSGGGSGWGPGGGSSSGSSSKAIKAMGTAYVYGGNSEINTATNGAEGLESKTAIYIEGGQHYFKCYDDCINSSGKIFFNGGVTVCYSNGNDAVDSNAGTTGAITIGDGVVFAYTTAGGPEEGLDCDNNSYIQLTGKGIAISAGGTQGGGGWGGSSNTISNAAQGYYFYTSSVSYTTGRYYTLADANGNNLVTYSFEGNVSSTLALHTATGMVKGSTYNVKYSTTAPTDATTAFHGLYLGSSATGTTSAFSFTAQ
ncbi:MAG: carbohydrate-binding domain-containing protein [Muribaculaceae bacterium]|nr:carbohydrate-binding domain-containing protein [Muribaculaceae bacterium]